MQDTECHMVVRTGFKFQDEIKEESPLMLLINWYLMENITE